MNYSLEIDDTKVGSRAPQLFICSKHLSKLHITCCRTGDVQDDMRRLCMKKKRTVLSRVNRAMHAIAAPIRHAEESEIYVS